MDNTRLREHDKADLACLRTENAKLRQINMSANEIKAKLIAEKPQKAENRAMVKNE